MHDKLLLEPLSIEPEVEGKPQERDITCFLDQARLENVLKPPRAIKNKEQEVMEAKE